MPSEPRAEQPAQYLHIAAGPLAFGAILLLPVESMTYPIRCSIGLLFWTAWWWITRPVHLAVTGLVPLAVVAIFDFIPIGEVLPSYADELIILLAAANILSSVWHRWGFDKRIALVSLLGVGSGATRQILVWYAISALLATLFPRSVVAATMIPIVIAMLRFIGIEDLWNSRFGTALVLAIAWGASLGGFLTPLGGAPNLLAMKFVENTVTHREFLFVTWVTRLIPLTLASVLTVFLYIRFALQPEIREAPRSRTFLAEQLHSLGPLSAGEKWGVALFAAATILAFTRQLYSAALPGLTPAFAFLAFGILCFMVRSARQPLITWEYAQEHMMWGLFYVFAGGTALGAVLNKTGTAKYMADFLVPYAQGGGLIAMIVFCVLTMVLAQIVSNVATVAITVPVAISVFSSLETNPMPFIYAIIAASHCGFMLPSSAGSSAIAAGYGVNLKTMFVKGFWAALLSLVVIILVAYLSMLLWPGFGQA